MSGTNCKKRPYLQNLAAMVLLFLLLTFVASCGSQGGGATDPGEEPYSEPIRIRIGYSRFDYPPLHYHDEDDSLVGFDIDLACSALTLMNAEPEFVPIDWTNKSALLEENEVDMLWGGLEKDTLSDSKVKFTKAYLRSNIVLLMDRENDYTRFEDLNGLNICALNFSPAFYYLQEYNRDVIKSRRAFTPPEYQDLLNALSSGSFDCMIADTSFASFLIKTTGVNYKMSSTILDSEYAVAVREEDADLLKSLQQALDKLEANGTITQLHETWIR